MANSSSKATITIDGRLSIKSIRPDGTVRDSREGDNIMTVTGKSAMAAALVWSGIQDQAANLGVTTPTYLTPLAGAVGTGTGTVSNTDNGLFTEVARQIVGAGAFSPATTAISAQVTWLFYFPSPASVLTLTEAGVFANAPSNVNGGGTMMDHWVFTPSITVPTTDTMILQATFSIS